MISRPTYSDIFILFLTVFDIGDCVIECDAFQHTRYLLFFFMGARSGGYIFYKQVQAMLGSTCPPGLGHACSGAMMTVLMLMLKEYL